MKLYVIARRDLPWSVRCVQAIHAATNLAYEHGQGATNVDYKWEDNYGPYLVLLGVDDVDELAEFCKRKGAMPYYEPDLGGELTAVAIFAEKLDTHAKLL